MCLLWLFFYWPKEFDVFLATIQFRLHRLDPLDKLGLHLAFDRRRGFALLQSRNGINRSPILHHLEVEMRSGGEAGLPDESDQFSLLDRTAGANALRDV